MSADALRLAAAAVPGQARGASPQTAIEVDASTALTHGSASDEYKSICEFMRLYATLRFYRLALLLGTTGSIVTALSLHAVRAHYARVEMLKFGGLLVSLAFLVMEYRATAHWHLLRSRSNELAQQLRFLPFPTASRWDPLTTSGAGFYLYSVIAVLWFVSLFLPAGA